VDGKITIQTVEGHKGRDLLYIKALAFAFSGGFLHAGAPVSKAYSSQDRKSLEAVLDTADPTGVVTTLHSFKKLDRFARLHFSVWPDRLKEKDAVRVKGEVNLAWEGKD